jgi:hypothetical protein
MMCIKLHSSFIFPETNKKRRETNKTLRHHKTSKIHHNDTSHLISFFLNKCHKRTTWREEEEKIYHQKKKPINKKNYQ